MRIILNDDTEMNVDDGPMTFNEDGTLVFTSGGTPVCIEAWRLSAAFDGDGECVIVREGDYLHVYE